MKPGADHRFFFLIAGEKLSDLFSSYGLTSHVKDYGEMLGQDLTEYEDEMIDTSSGHETYEACEADALAAMREADVPFAVVFKGAKIYGYITKNDSKTFEVI